GGAPGADGSCGRSGIGPPGIGKGRGPTVGPSRGMPSPASRARRTSEDSVRRAGCDGLVLGGAVVFFGMRVNSSVARGRRPATRPPSVLGGCGVLVARRRGAGKDKVARGRSFP